LLANRLAICYNKAMTDKNYIKCLGTAGARFVMAKQLRYSGGIFIRLKGKNIMLDPGPGALVRLARSRPPIDVTRLDAIILTHMHIDHTNDVNVLLDAMTGGGLHKKGMLFAPEECLVGENRVVLNYLQGFLDDIEELKPETGYRIGSLRFTTSLRHKHGAETYGIIFNLDGKKISFLSDTKYFPELLKSYKGSSVMVVNVVRSMPFEFGDILHLSLADVKHIVSAVKPERVIITHLGMTMIKKSPVKLSRELTKEFGTEVTVASDGMTVYL